jgi:hypothetical protein
MTGKPQSCGNLQAIRAAERQWREKSALQSALWASNSIERFVSPLILIAARS